MITPPLNIIRYGANMMPECQACAYFFPIPEDAIDFEKGKGDCVTQVSDEKGKYWLLKPVFYNDPACQRFNPAQR
jgi:benzylsuccinate synthase/naphthyl-2-methylsuccinate synthase gamma subunit